MFSYALVNPIWNINGVRMWTAAQIFLFGNLQYFIFKNKKGLLYSSLSVLFHFSFIFPTALLFLYLFLPNKISIYFIFYLLVTLVKEINLLTVRESLSFLPQIFQPKVITYTDESYAQRIIESSSKFHLHVILAQNISRWFMFLWVLILYIYRKLWIPQSKKLESIFSFALFLGGWAQLASLIPSGGRFLVLADGLFYGIFILVLTQRTFYTKTKTIRLISTPLLLYIIIFKIRMGFDFIGISVIFSNPILALLLPDQTPLISFIKHLL